MDMRTTDNFEGWKTPHGPWKKRWGVFLLRGKLSQKEGQLRASRKPTILSWVTGSGSRHWNHVKYAIDHLIAVPWRRYKVPMKEMLQLLKCYRPNAGTRHCRPSDLEVSDGIKEGHETMWWPSDLQTYQTVWWLASDPREWPTGCWNLCRCGKPSPEEAALMIFAVFFVGEYIDIDGRTPDGRCDWPWWRLSNINININWAHLWLALFILFP